MSYKKQSKHLNFPKFCLCERGQLYWNWFLVGYLVCATWEAGKKENKVLGIDTDL